MTSPVSVTEIWRGDLLESVHTGHAVICGANGEIEQAWGDPDAVIYPRSSCKMVQALPLIESGAADAAGLTTEQIALACASHQGAAIHTDRVAPWLAALGLGEADLRCGPQPPQDIPERNRLVRADEKPCQLHNNCSGKHAGFLTLNRHLGGDAEYHDFGHPVQQAARDAFVEVTGQESPTYAIDGCSAPNFATTLHGLGRAMAGFATARDRSGTRAEAQVRLVDAMTAHPDLVAGETRACTELMRAMDGKVAIKTGAEGVYVAILPKMKKAIALKISDGGTRAAECAIAALLVKLGALDADHPATRKRLDAPIVNWNGIECGTIRAADTLR